jgi:hypothetical protein
MRALLSVIIGLAIAGVALSQGVQRDPGLFRGGKKEKDDGTRSVQGVVRNASDQPVERAVVYLKDTKTLRVKSFITQQDGQYQFHGLSTDVDYELHAKHENATSDVRTLSVFDSRKQAVVNLKVEEKKGGSKS